MEGVESENNAAADAERERRYREYMNESFNNFAMNNSFVGDLKSREESEFDEIHEFINEVNLAVFVVLKIILGGNECIHLENRRRERRRLDDDDPFSAWHKD